MSEWISCSDGLPGAMAYVLVTGLWNGERRIYMARYKPRSKRWQFAVGSWNALDVTHWMPLPQPPSESE